MADRLKTLKLVPASEHVLHVIFDRPEVSNAINTQMGRELLQVFTGFALEPGDFRAIVLTGRGQRAFCAGGDLKERNGMSDSEWRSQHVVFEHMVRAIMECPLPLIAAVEGAAYAGGCELALACDFVYAAQNARFALTEVTLGIIPGAGGTQNLPRAVGERRAKELILRGEPFGAAEAYEWGMVNRLCEPGAALADATESAVRIARNAPVAVRQAKRAIHLGLQMSLRDGMDLEVDAYNRAVVTEDRQEGVRAFNEKRAPRFFGH